MAGGCTYTQMSYLCSRTGSWDVVSLASRDCTLLCDAVLAAAETDAQRADSPVCLLSWHIAVPLAKLQLFVVGLF